MVKATDPADPDFQSLKNAQVTIKKTGQSLQNSLEEASGKAVLLEIQRKIVNSPPVLVKNRKLIKQGQVLVLEKKNKSRYYLLFSDALWITKEKSKGQLRYKWGFDFKCTEVRDLQQTNSECLCCFVADVVKQMDSNWCVLENIQQSSLCPQNQNQRRHHYTLNWQN